MSADHLGSSDRSVDCPLVYLTITWGAAARTASVAMMVNKVNVIRQRRSRTWGGEIFYHFIMKLKFVESESGPSP